MIAYTPATAAFWLVLPLGILCVRWVRWRIKVQRNSVLREMHRQRNH